MGEGDRYMAKRTVSVKVDDDIKEAAEALFRDHGLTMSQAIRFFLRAVVKEKSILYEVESYNFNEETREALAEAKEMEKHPERYKTYNSVEEMMKDLESDD